MSGDPRGVRVVQIVEDAHDAHLYPQAASSQVRHWPSRYRSLSYRRPSRACVTDGLGRSDIASRLETPEFLRSAAGGKRTSYRTLVTSPVTGEPSQYPLPTVRRRA